MKIIPAPPSIKTGNSLLTLLVAVAIGLCLALVCEVARWR